MRYFREHFDGSERRISRTGKVRVHRGMRERGKGGWRKQSQQDKGGHNTASSVPLNPQHPFNPRYLLLRWAELAADLPVRPNSSDAPAHKMGNLQLSTR